MSTAWPAAPPCGWWMRIRACGRAKRLPVRPGGEQHRGGRGGLADADRRHVGLDVLHRVVDREEPGDLAAGRVDVDRDVLVRVFALEVQQLGDDQVGDRVVDRRAEEDDALLEQPGVDVERALAAVRLLDDRGDEVVPDRLAHSADSSFGCRLSSGASVCLGWRRPRGGVRSTRVAVLVDDRGVVDQELAGPCLGRCQSVPPRARPAVRDPAAPSRASRPTRSASRSISASTSSSVASMLLLRRRRPAARGRPCTASVDASRDVGDERLLLLAGGREVLRDGGALRLEPVREVVQPALHLLLRRAARAARCRRGSASGLEHLVAHEHLRLHLARTSSSRLADVGAQLVDGVELARPPTTHSSSTSGRTLRLASLTRTWKATSSPARSPKRSGSVSLNLRMSPGRLPTQLGRRARGRPSSEPTS